MKRMIALALSVLAVFSLCACGGIARSQSSSDEPKQNSVETKSSESETKEGYFVDYPTIIVDRWGEQIGEHHCIKAIAPVEIIQDSPYDWGIVRYVPEYPSFSIGVGTYNMGNYTDSRGSLKEAYYKIDGIEYQATPHPFYAQDSLGKNSETKSQLVNDDFDRVYTALMDGKDVKFSFGFCILTVYGEGFSSFVDLYNLPPAK